MGILANALTIVLGGFFGSLFKSRFDFRDTRIFGICVMLISAAGVIENLFGVSGTSLESGNLLFVVFALMAGSLLGSKFRLSERMSRLSSENIKTPATAAIDAALFFGIGGLQICGPILLALNGDSSQLYLKSLVDLPFALMYGSLYGKSVMLSAIPVAAVQILIALAAHLSGDFVSDAMLSQLCSVGYIILLLGGYNLFCETDRKIDNISAIPAIPMVIVFNAVSGILR